MVRGGVVGQQCPAPRTPRGSRPVAVFEKLVAVSIRSIEYQRTSFVLANEGRRSVSAWGMSPCRWTEQDFKLESLILAQSER